METAHATPEELSRHEQIRIEMLRNPELANQLVDELIRDSKGDPSALVRALLFKGQLRIFEGDDEGQLRLAEQALEISRKHSIPIGEADALRNIGAYHADHHNIALAFKYLTEALDRSVANDHARQMASVHNALGVLHAVIADYDHAVKHLSASIELLTVVGDNVDLAYAHFNFATLYSMTGRNDKAIEHLNASIACSERDSNQFSHANALGSLGRIYQAQGEFQKAVEHCEQSLEVGKKFPNFRHRMFAYGQLALAHAELNNTAPAEKYLALIQREVVRPEEEKKIDSVWQLCGKALMKLGRKKEALDLYLRAAGLHIDGTNQNIIEDIHTNLAQLYAEANNMECAFHHQQLLSELRAEHRKRLVQQAISNADSRRDIIDVEREVRAAKFTEGENRRYLVERLTLSQARRNAEIRSVRAELEKELPRTEGQARRIAAETLELIGRVMEEDQDLPQIDSFLGGEYDELVSRLTERCPALTPTEVRVCILIRLNLPSREIADSMFVTLDTVKSHRKSIRSRLKLPAGKNLAEFLTELAKPQA